MTGTWEDFEGRNGLEDFAALAAWVLVKNELGSDSDGYELVHAGTSGSGYTFGGNQMDLGSPGLGRTVLKDILTNAKDANNQYIINNGAAFYDTHESDLITTGNPSAVSSTNIALIDSALRSEYGKTAINYAFTMDLAIRTAKVESFINGLPDGNIKYLLQTSDAMKAYLLDYQNQFGLNVGEKMHEFLKGNEVSFDHTPLDPPLQLKGDIITFKDIRNFIDHTLWGTGHQNDVIRRHDNLKGILADNGLSIDGLPAHHLTPELGTQYASAGSEFPRHDPLVLDLDGDGVELIDMRVSTAFLDYNGDNLAEKTGWVSSDDGLLARDDNNNGVIDGLGELFGNATQTGYQELATYDTNFDGKITSADAQFSTLLVWRDLDSDGISDSGELQTLTSLGISEISLQHITVDHLNAGNVVEAVGSFIKNNVTHTMNEVLFTVDTALTVPTFNLDIDINLEATGLPLSGGYGSLPAWHIAMSANSDMLLAMQEIVSTQPDDFNNIDQQISAFLYEWADATSIVPTSRGLNVDARQIAVMEAVMGRLLFNGGAIPTMNVPLVNDAWKTLYTELESRILAQGPMKDVFPDAKYSFETGKMSFGTDLSAILDAADEINNGNIVYWAKFADLLIKNITDFTGSAQSNMSDVASLMNDKGFDISTIVNFIHGVNGNEELTGSIGDDFIYGGNGASPLLSGSSGNDYIYAGGGNDFVSGDNGNDTLYGEAGDDTIVGGNGNDTLIGGTGNDTLEGGAGVDTYYLGLGDGLDIVTEDSAQILSERGNNIIRLGEGIAVTDVRLSSNGSHLNIHLMQNGVDTGDILTLMWQYNHMNANANWITNAIKLHDNTQIDLSQGWILTDKAGSSSLMTSSIGNDVLYGLDGDDSMSAGGGNDLLYGGDGHDELIGADGNDVLYGGTGDDFVSGDSGTDVLYGEEGNDYLVGGSGNDSLYGGVGIDTLEGGSGLDTYYFNLGDGTDTVIESTNQSMTERGNNVIQLGAGITAADVRLSSNGTHLNVHLMQNGIDTGDVLILQGQHNYTNSNFNWITSAIKLYDNTQIDLSQGWILTDKPGMSSLMTSSSGNDVLYGLDGNDSMSAGGGNDLLYGGDGHDELIGADGEDVLYGGTGDDFVSGDSGIDVLYGEEGNDYLVGGTGNDSLHGGTGVDTLEGGNGIDTYYFNLGDGTDTLIEGANQSVIERGNNIIQIGVGITAADVRMSSNGTHLNVHLMQNGIDTGDVLILQGQYNYTTTVFNWITSSIKLYDNTLIDLSQGWILTDKLGSSSLMTSATGNDTLYGFDGNDSMSAGAGNDVLYGGDGHDSLIGDDGDDILHGGSGDDEIYGGNGADFLYGGSGSDELMGGAGRDTYRFEYGSQLDNVTETVAGNTIEFGIGIDFDNLRVEKVSNNLKVHLVSDLGGATGDTLTVANQFTGIYIDTLKFSDNSVLDITKLHTVQGTASDDTISGNASANLIFGAQGDDTISGNDGEDVLIGGLGNDTLFGNNGDDIIHGGDGSDTLVGGDGTDILTGGAGADIFVLDTTLSIDIITDFKTHQSDKLDISDLLTGYSSGTSDLNDFVQLTTSGNNTTLVIDRDGSGTAYSGSNMATLSNVSGLSVDDMLLNNNFVLD